MLGRLRERRERKRQEIETRMAIVDAAYGRLDGEDSAEVEQRMLAALTEAPDLNDPIDNQALIEQLEGQLQKLFQIIAEQEAMLVASTDVVVAARAFADIVALVNEKTGEPVFRTVKDDQVSVDALNYRYSDLAAVLNRIGRPVPPKLAQGTVH